MARAKNYKKYFKLLILPFPFEHLHFKLHVAPPEFDFDINIFYSILSDLSNFKLNKSDPLKSQWIPLASTFLKEKYGNDYNKYLQYLVSFSIICNSSYYLKGNCYYYSINNNKESIVINKEHQAYSYCFQVSNTNGSETIDSIDFQENRNLVKSLQMVSVKILKSSKLGKRMSKLEYREKDRIKHSPKYIQEMYKHYFSEIGIDYNAAINYTIGLFKQLIHKAKSNEEKLKVVNKIQQRLRSIEELKDEKKGGLLRFNRNSTNKRVDTNLTNMASDLRRFITGYDKFSYIDLNNSQPVLFNILLTQVKSPPLKLFHEIQEYRQITTSGGWYEFLGSLYEVDRNKAKKLWMLIAYSNNKARSGKKRFANRFPGISRIIEKYKEKEYQNFAIQLQKIESQYS